MSELSMSTANSISSMLANNAFGSLSLGDHVNKVRGVEGMNTFQTKPSSEYALFEEESNIFCYKTTDEKNQATDRYFAFQEITKEEALQMISPYLMKGELESFKENMLAAIRDELSSFKEEILNAQQPIRSGNANINGKSYNQQRNRTADNDQQ